MVVGVCSFFHHAIKLALDLFQATEDQRETVSGVMTPTEGKSPGLWVLGGLNLKALRSACGSTLAGDTSLPHLQGLNAR
jgi:hypothetical protein